MKPIELISFDAEGTLVTPDFSQAIWHETIPALYAQKNNIELARAREIVAGEYAKVGDQRLEWYDVGYWFGYFQLGPPEPAIKSCVPKVSYYSEVKEVLSSLEGRYRLVVSSGTPLELLEPQLESIKNYFAGIFSSISLCQGLKTPRFYAYVSELMEVSPDRIVHVGDSWQFDYLNSRQAGINVFHLDRKGGGEESLTSLLELETRLTQL
jgi:putative hydrolase of the HAD superfamily